jgi:hypothetical protein
MKKVRDASKIPNPPTRKPRRQNFKTVGKGLQNYQKHVNKAMILVNT